MVCNKLVMIAALKSKVKKVLDIALKYLDKNNFLYKYINLEQYINKKYIQTTTQMHVYVEQKDRSKTQKTKTTLRKIGRGSISNIDKLLYLFIQEQIKNYYNSINLKPPLQTRYKIYKLYSQLIKFKLKKTSNLENNNNKISSYFY